MSNPGPRHLRWSAPATGTTEGFPGQQEVLWAWVSLEGLSQGLGRPCWWEVLWADLELAGGGTPQATRTVARCPWLSPCSLWGAAGGPSSAAGWPPAVRLGPQQCVHSASPKPDSVTQATRDLPWGGAHADCGLTAPLFQPPDALEQQATSHLPPPRDGSATCVHQGRLTTGWAHAAAAKRRRSLCRKS